MAKKKKMEFPDCFYSPQLDEHSKEYHGRTFNSYSIKELLDDIDLNSENIIRNRKVFHFDLVAEFGNNADYIGDVCFSQENGEKSVELNIKSKYKYLFDDEGIKAGELNGIGKLKEIKKVWQLEKKAPRKNLVA